MKRVTFSVPGAPRGKGRPRAVAKIKHGPDGPEAYVQLVTPAETRQAESEVRAAFRHAHPDHKPWTGAVQINFTAVFQTPASFNKALKAAAARGELYCTSKPDKDNIEKMIVDALNGIAFADDAQVMGGGIKRYGTPPRIDISLKSLASAEIPATPGQKRAERAQQGTLPLRDKRQPGGNPTKPGFRADEVLGKWDPKTRELIRAALARDDAEKAKRG